MVARKKSSFMTFEELPVTEMFILWY